MRQIPEPGAVGGPAPAANTGRRPEMEPPLRRRNSGTGPIPIDSVRAGGVQDRHVVSVGGTVLEGI